MINPANGEKLARVPLGAKKDVDAAVQAAATSVQISETEERSLNGVRGQGTLPASFRGGQGGDPPQVDTIPGGLMMLHVLAPSFDWKTY